jgi:predicted ferric reductase
MMNKPDMRAKAVLLTGYCIAVLLPTVIAFAVASPLADGILYGFGKILVLIAFPVLALQPLLAARLRYPDRVFGLDQVMRFHRFMAIAAALMVLFHPLLLAAGLSWWELLTTLELPWYVLSGRTVLLAVLAIAATSLLVQTLRFSFERWRTIHNVLAIFIVTVGFIHSILSGSSLSSRLMQLIWGVYLLIALFFHFRHKVILPRQLKKSAFTVSSIAEEAPGVRTLTLKPQRSKDALVYLPGQFQFLSLGAGKDGRFEEHPFTISSAPDSSEKHCATIKALGDFTRRIEQLSPGSQALVQGPFGRFSYHFHSGEEKLFFIAGGIGITPIMSMIRALDRESFSGQVTLLYGNRSEGDIAFRKELAGIARSGRIKLKLVHLLQKKPEGQAEEGETVREGFITRQILEEYSGSETAATGFYICGPPIMMKSVSGHLRSMGITKKYIHMESFAL